MRPQDLLRLLWTPEGPHPVMQDSTRRRRGKGVELSIILEIMSTVREIGHGMIPRAPPHRPHAAGEKGLQALTGRSGPPALEKQRATRRAGLRRVGRPK